MRDNYFSPSFGNKPRTMVGRDMDIRYLAEGLHSNPGNKERARLIIGQRGLGKTVLLLDLADYARKHNYIVASPTVVSSGMLARIIEKLRRDGSQYFHDKKVSISGGSVGILGFSAGIQTERQGQVSMSFAAQLLDICEMAGAAGKGVLILVDEVQAGSEELKELIIAYQEMVGEGQNISVVFAGLPSAVSRTLNQRVLTFFNRASKLHLKPISLAEISVYFKATFDAAGIKIDETWIDQAAAATEGSPYMMQLIGHYIVVSASDSGHLTKDNFFQALTLARREFIVDICETTLSPLSNMDVAFLKAMASDESVSTMKDIGSRLGVDAAYAQRYKTRLVQAGVITQPRRGLVEYDVPYLRELYRVPDVR